MDSIGKTSSIGRHFGELYFNFLLLVERQLENADSATQRMVRNFEKVFAQFFIDACIAYKDHQQISLPAWRAYFADTTLEAAQYKLLGTNAHLNGGLSEAIAGSYSPDEWTKIKQKYFLFNSCLNQTYQLVYKEAITTNKNAKLLDMLTVGLDKAVGKFYLYKWRKRQMRLTELYFCNSPKYQKTLTKIIRKKDRLDKAICVLL
ncbi:MAG: hypothetical protein JJE22_15770 [Bacteroidia bacterium]|nr:hypothetical protein [Bacteroidia bacterium]